MAKAAEATWGASPWTWSPAGDVTAAAAEVASARVKGCHACVVATPVTISMLSQPTVLVIFHVEQLPGWSGTGSPRIDVTFDGSDHVTANNAAAPPLPSDIPPLPADAPPPNRPTAS